MGGDYIPRIVDSQLSELIHSLPAVVIDGAKGVGKTRTASRQSASAFSLLQRSQRVLVEADPAIIQQASQPVLIDEWQRLPWIWDEVKTWVDEDSSAGRFLLTGSASPRQVALHSGAGRIVRLRMRPLSLAERGICQPTVSLADLLSGRVDKVSGQCQLGVRDYVHEIVSSGFPGFRHLADRPRQSTLDGYIETIVSREFPEQGLMVRKPQSLLAWMRAYAAATGSTASYSQILDAATPGDVNKPAASTTLVYREVLASLWMTDPVPAWSPSSSQLGALGKSSKHFLADPALAVRLLRLTEDQLLSGRTEEPLGPQRGVLLGRLFEALVALSLQTYAGAAGAELFHVRTARGDHEIDFIVERDDRVVAVEVKLAQSVDAADLKHLTWLGTIRPNGRLEKVVVTTGDQAYTRRDGIHVVPAGLLGP